MRFETLSEWLSWQETLHPQAVDLGLERCRRVAAAMGMGTPPFALISVAGTNGKGSCVEILDRILRAGGYRTGAYFSPHLARYNERIRIGGREVADGDLVQAFARVDRARADTSLTYFEFGTLAAIDLFMRAPVEVALLEVGLGGRLDAVNLLDADVAVIASVDVDHVEWLGRDVDGIAREKAGILRRGRAAVCGQPDAPAVLDAIAAELGARLHRAGRDYHFEEQGPGWSWRHGERRLRGLPRPGIAGAAQVQNAAAALTALDLLRGRLTLPRRAVERGLREARLRGRFEVLPGPVERIVDVAHNVQAARHLAASLAARPCRGRTLAVLAMLADKDPAGVGAALREAVDAWYVAGLPGARGARARDTAERLRPRVAPRPVHALARVADAQAAALEEARPGDRVVVFGSFYTAAEVLRLET